MAMSSTEKMWWLGGVCVQICGVWCLLGAVLDTISSSLGLGDGTIYLHTNLIGPDRWHHGLFVQWLLHCLSELYCWSIFLERNVCMCVPKKCVYVSMYSPYNNVGQSAVSQMQGDQITAIEARCVFFLKKNLIAMGPWGYSVPTKSQLAWIDGRWHHHNLVCFKFGFFSVLMETLIVPSFCVQKKKKGNKGTLDC